MKKFLLSAAALALTIAPTAAQTPPFETSAPVAFMEDLSSGAVLYAKDADRRMPPASMAKMMTVYVAFDLIKQGKLKLDQQVDVRPETWRKWHGPAAGSTMFLSTGREGQRRESAQRHRRALRQRCLRRAGRSGSRVPRKRSSI